MLPAKFFENYATLIKDKNNDYEFFLSKQVKGSEPSKEYGLLMIDRSLPEFNKRYIESLINAFSEAALKQPTFANTLDSTINKNGFDLGIANVIYLLGEFMQYFINSISWEQQEIRSCDEYEFTARITKLLNQIQYANRK